MQLRSFHLIVAIVVISLLAEVSHQLSSARYYSFESGILLAYILIFLNAAIAVAGLLWTPHHAAWTAYLVVSVALTVLIGAVTPLSVIGIAARLLAPP
jgi:hypothetical protein